MNGEKDISGMGLREANLFSPQYCLTNELF